MTLPAQPATAEDEVRRIEDAYDRAWSEGDLESLVACFTGDAVLINPRGDVATGVEQIRAALGGFLAGEAHGTVHESSIERVSFVGGDVAVVDGNAAIRRRIAEAPLYEHPFTDIVVKTEVGWRIAHVRAYEFGGPPADFSRRER